ncbi:uncharacterized protein F4807DRAFT_465068 [Annulohypoxylon truncatum]|uniref:uncharacterized protein n=1 Tax=Annulohypoxylon truncatum TaxID=327061 RepID=UPI0020073958|nr:uncharacterized protein F4807DRAFT_465068 [Annulohypoxylon truncatum]KAI1205101.1 hypothetical protein F4807DRAFT_465068 [Annulohypoxylon truncatum]
MPQNTPQPPARTPTDSHCATHNRRPWKAGEKKGLVVLVVAVLIVGVVFTVYYDAMYYSSGAFLLHDKTGNTLVERQDISLAGVGRDANLCGSDTGGGCEAFGRPNMCCPLGMTCKRSNFSPSGVFCCSSSSNCRADPDLPPRCDKHTSACNKSMGAGCCLHNTECDKDGCLKVYRAAPGFSTAATTLTTTSSTASVAGTKTTSSDAGGVTITTAKMAETALTDDGTKGIKPGFGYSSCPLLEVCALGGAIAVAYAMALGG